MSSLEPRQLGNILQAVPMTSGSSVTCWGPPTLQSGPREREQCYIHHTTIWPPSQTSPSFIIQQGCYIPMVWEGFALRKCLACLDSSKCYHSSMRDISSNYTFSLIPRPSVQCVCTVLRVWERDYYTLYALPTSMEWHWSLYVETTHGDLWNLVTMLWPMGLQKLLQSYYIERTASLLLSCAAGSDHSRCLSGLPRTVYISPPMLHMPFQSAPSPLAICQWLDTKQEEM